MEVNHVDIWSDFLDNIREKLSDQSYSTWFKPIVPINFKQNKLTVQIPSQFFYEFLETH